MGLNKKGGRLIGYARVSTQDQNLDMQIQALKATGCAEKQIYVEKRSAMAKRRPVLEMVMSSLRPGDTLVIWKLDRLARNVKHMIQLVERIEKAGADFKSLMDAHIDTTTAIGRYLFVMNAAQAQLERDTTQERTQFGVRTAIAMGKVFGQPKAIKDPKAQADIIKWRAEKPKPVPYQTIRDRLIELHGVKVSVTTITKYATGQVKVDAPAKSKPGGKPKR